MRSVMKKSPGNKGFPYAEIYLKYSVFLVANGTLLQQRKCNFLHTYWEGFPCLKISVSPIIL